MAPPVELGPLTRCMIAVGAKRYRLERRCGMGSGRFVALHPDSLAQILRLGELHYAGNSRSFVELVGLEFVADESLPRGYVEVRGSHPAEASDLSDAGAWPAGHGHHG
jgi:hypothetical protein